MTTSTGEGPRRDHGEPDVPIARTQEDPAELEHRPTTTHDPTHGGSPRLALEQESYLEGERQSLWYLEGDLVTIGSSSGCDIVLPGLEPLHAVVRRDAADELSVVTEGPEVRVHGAPVRTQLLRSGARLELGGHVLAYYRDEHADHGRPFGGREGGEIGRQRSQPSRGRIERDP